MAGERLASFIDRKASLAEEVDWRITELRRGRFGAAAIESGVKPCAALPSNRRGLRHKSA
jgi:hypothetical protein